MIWKKEKAVVEKMMEMEKGFLYTAGFIKLQITQNKAIAFK